MSNFTKIQIYSKGKTCFDDIKRSKKPYILINVDAVSSLENKETWGFCEGHEKYPYRILRMINGDYFYVTLESADNLESYLYPSKL